MTRENGVEGVITFIGREDIWRERLDGVLVEHLGSATEEFDLDFEDLGDLLG